MILMDNDFLKWYSLNLYSRRETVSLNSTKSVEIVLQKERSVHIIMQSCIDT